MLLLEKKKKKMWQVYYRYSSISTVGEESCWLLLGVTLENKSVVARSWGVLNLDILLIHPGLKSIQVEPFQNLVPERFVAVRASTVAFLPKGTAKKIRASKKIKSY